jgi:hypothetical protein
MSMDQYISDYDPKAPLPKIGSRWIWEIDSPHARTLVEIDDVRWNGEQWWVYLRQLSTNVPIAERDRLDETGVYANDLSRFWEACTPVGGRAEDMTEHRPADAKGTEVGTK